MTFTGSFTDDGDTHTATWSFDATTTAGTVMRRPTRDDDPHLHRGLGYNVTLKVTTMRAPSGRATTVGDVPAMIVVHDPPRPRTGGG